MANLHHDLTAECTFSALNTYGTAISSTAALTAVDCAAMASNMATAVITCSAVASSGNVTVKMQESSDNSTFTDITGATATITTANTVTNLSFPVTKQYVRAYGTLNSGTSVTAQVTLITNRKYPPANTPSWTNETGLGT